MSDITWAIVLFVALWVLTFYPAWLLLLRLLAISASPRPVTWSFWGLLLLYRVLIALPYVVLLIAGADVLPKVIEIVLIGFLAFGLGFSIVRFAFRPHLVAGLWWLYGFVYDGLRHFAPYRRLIEKVVNAAYQTAPHATRILELGSGSGNVLQALSKRYPHAQFTGVDSSRSMLRSAHKKVPTAEIIQADMVTYVQSAPSASFDLVVMQNSLYAAQRREVLWPELSRILAPDGVVVITNSDRAGSSSITKEHLQFGRWYELLHPKLILVGVIDAYISQLSKTGSFHFLEESQISRETEPYFVMSGVERCYGGVNILFTLKKDTRE